MDLCEHLVMQFLTKDAHRFLSPQYSIRGDTGGEWSCPDFVALDFHEKVVSIVEVSSAHKPRSLVSRVQKRDKQWIALLKDQLTANRVVDETWSYRVEVFIREDAEASFRKAIGDPPDVHVHVLEKLGTPWQWERSSLPAGNTTSISR